MARPESSDTTYAHIPLASTQCHGSTEMQGNLGHVAWLCVPEEETACILLNPRNLSMQVCLMLNSSPLESAVTLLSPNL